jgi:flagellar biosynthesis protein FliR
LDLLPNIAVLLVFQTFLVFCRVGTAMMTMPGFGDLFVSVPSRLGLAVVITFIMTSVMEKTLPQQVPADAIQMMSIIILEVLTGLVLGATARIIQSTLQTAGTVIAMQSSLASAMMFDATQGSQSSVISNFMTIAGLTLLFSSNMHHMLLRAISDSYEIFPVGGVFESQESANMIRNTVSSSFMVAFQLAAPLVIIGTLINVAAGIMGKMMPQMQVFFVMVPGQLLVSFLILSMTIASILLRYKYYFSEIMQSILLD